MTNGPEDMALADGAPTAAPMDGVYTHPDRAFRTLAWLQRATKGRAADVDLSGLSEARRGSVADLVRNGLVSERRWVGGAMDGRHTLKITQLGAARLAAAQAAADLVVLG